MNFIIFGFIFFSIYSVIADNLGLQQQLVNIASKEAEIANIGANKVMMLYGISNPIPIINNWNSIEHKAPLTNFQINQINVLELEKQKMLKQVMQ
jgi:hypothetical protein